MKHQILTVMVFCICTTLAAQERNMPNISLEQAHAAQWQEPVSMQGEKLPWAHEIRVSLPPAYALEPEKTYPVLWVTDGGLYFGTASEMAALYAILGDMPQVIVVGVGHPPSVSRQAFQQMRSRDFIFSDYLPFDVRNDEDPVLVKHLEDNPTADLSAVQAAALHGAAFLDYLVDELRPALASQYRMSDEHALFGHSGGSMFVARAMFARPGAFQRYIMSSGLSYDAFKAEAAYAQAQDDLAARVFVAAGDNEAAEPQRASQRLVSNTMRFAENLALREYPSLDLEVRLYRDKNHTTVPAASLSEGMIWAFGD